MQQRRRLARKAARCLHLFLVSRQAIKEMNGTKYEAGV